MGINVINKPPGTLLICKVLLICSIFPFVELCAQTSAASAKKQKRIQWTGHALSEVRTLRELPADIQAVLGVGTPGMNGIADRDGEYNPTDVVNPNLPMRRFLVAGLDGDATLVAIEHGGLGWRLDVILFKKTAVERNWTLYKSPQSLRELVDRLPRR